MNEIEVLHRSIRGNIKRDCKYQLHFLSMSNPIEDRDAEGPIIKVDCEIAVIRPERYIGNTDDIKEIVYGDLCHSQIKEAAEKNGCYIRFPKITQPTRYDEDKNVIVDVTFHIPVQERPDPLEDLPEPLKEIAKVIQL